jgi:hypothetical protein
MCVRSLRHPFAQPLVRMKNVPFHEDDSVEVLAQCSGRKQSADTRPEHDGGGSTVGHVRT